MAGETPEVLMLEKIHCWLGHIALETAKKMVSKGSVNGIDIDLTTMIQHCNSCKYVKATRKPIKKTCKAPIATRFGDKIHSDMWGPSPVQTPGWKEYYISFTDDYTHWTHLKLLAMKDKVLQAYQDFKAWAKLHFEIQAFKYLQSNWGGEYLGKEFCSYLSAQGTKQKIMVHDDESHSFLQLEKTKSTHFYQQLISTSSIDIQLTYNQHPIDSKEATEDF